MNQEHSAEKFLLIGITVIVIAILSALIIHEMSLVARRIWSEIPLIRF